MKVDAEAVVGVIQMLKESILNIDTGCPVCIRRFITDCNEVFKAHKLEVEIVYNSKDDEDDFQILVRGYPYDKLG